MTALASTAIDFTQFVAEEIDGRGWRVRRCLPRGRVHMRIHAAAGTAILALLAAGCEPTVNPPPAVAASITARFDPLGQPPVVPTPNDLALTGGNGFLNVPDQPGDSDAQKAFNAYLRTLTG